VRGKSEGTRATTSFKARGSSASTVADARAEVFGDSALASTPGTPEALAVAGPAPPSLPHASANTSAHTSAGDPRAIGVSWMLKKEGSR
jgi:hypothetical protein